MKGRRVLPRGRLRGRFVITDAVVAASERLLPTFRGPDGDHEGLIFWFGLELTDVTIFTSAIAPRCDHGPGYVRASPAAVADAARAGRAEGLGLLAQIHSHPLGETEHSPGDDELVLMPFEGMLSVVVAHYARWGLRPIGTLGIHQYQDGRWVLIDEGIDEGVTIVRSGIDLRSWQE